MRKICVPKTIKGKYCKYDPEKLANIDSIVDVELSPLELSLAEKMGLFNNRRLSKYLEINEAALKIYWKDKIGLEFEPPLLGILDRGRELDPIFVRNVVEDFCGVTNTLGIFRSNNKLRFLQIDDPFYSSRKGKVFLDNGGITYTEKSDIFKVKGYYDLCFELPEKKRSWKKVSLENLFRAYSANLSSK